MLILVGMEVLVYDCQRKKVKKSLKVTKHRSSDPEVFLKKGALKISTKFK